MAFKTEWLKKTVVILASLLRNFPRLLKKPRILWAAELFPDAHQRLVSSVHLPLYAPVYCSVSLALHYKHWGALRHTHVLSSPQGFGVNWSWVGSSALQVFRTHSQGCQSTAPIKDFWQRFILLHHGQRQSLPPEIASFLSTHLLLPNTPSQPVLSMPWRLSYLSCLSYLDGPKLCYALASIAPTSASCHIL